MNKTEETNKSPFIDDWHKLPCFVHFFLPCPYVVPFPHASTISFEREEDVDWLKDVLIIPTEEFSKEEALKGPKSSGKNFVSLCFYQNNKPIKYDPTRIFLACELASIMIGQIPDNKIVEEFISKDEKNLTHTTVIEGVTVLIPIFDENGPNENKSIESALDKVMDSLQRVLLSYRIASHDFQAGPMNLSTISPIIPFTTRTFNNPPVWGGLGLYIIERAIHTITAPKETMEPEIIKKVFSAFSRAVLDDAISTSTEMLWKATRALFILSDTRESVLYSQLSGEMYLDHILFSMAWESKIQPKVVSQWFSEQEGLVRRVSKYYSKFLPGNWDCSNPKTELGQWAINVCHLRNRVIHTGYEPSLEEAQKALFFAEMLLEILKQRLIEKSSKYPRTLLLLAGIPGLEKRGAYSKKIQEFVNNAHAEPIWIKSRNEWIEEFRSERAKKK